MAKRQRQFDFVAIMPHGGGRGAMQLSLGQCGDFDFILFRYGKRMEELQAWLNKNPHQYLGLILDHPAQPLPMEIIQLAVPDFPLLLMCRDIISYARTVHNHTLRRWADKSAALSVPTVPDVIRRESYVNFPADYIAEQVNSDIPLGAWGQWHKVFAALRVFAGPVMVVDFSDFTKPGSIPEIMRRSVLRYLTIQERGAA